MANRSGRVRSPRIAKILEDAGIKLDSVVSHLLGVSGRALRMARRRGLRAASADLVEDRRARRADIRNAPPLAGSEISAVPAVNFTALRNQLRTSK